MNFKVPIKDLIRYFNDLYRDHPSNTYRSIIDIIDTHYFALNNYHIKPIQDEIVMFDFCFGDIYEPEKIPLTEGALVRSKKTKKYGLMYYCGEYVNHNSISNYRIYYLNNKGYMVSCSYDPEMYEVCGLMTRFYKYNCSEENSELPLGSRVLWLGDNGLDVLEFQTILKKFDDNLNLTGFFDEQTLEIYHKAQDAYHIIPHTDCYNPRTDKILKYLCEV